MTKAIVIIDGQSLHFTAKLLDRRVDFKKLLIELDEPWRVYYFTTLIEGDRERPLVKLVDWLDFNGYTVKVTESRENGDESSKPKSSPTVDLVVTAMNAANYADAFIFLTGDRRYAPLIEDLKAKGKRITVLSTQQNDIVSNVLRRTADRFIDIKDWDCWQDEN